MLYNRHTAACGTPPALSHAAADLYVGYVADRYGEQWICAERPWELWKRKALGR